MVKKPQKLNTSARFNPIKPYNSLPPIPRAQALETLPVLRKLVGASRALAGLKEAARLIPNQDVLINSIPLREARDSSAIENIVTTNDTLFKFANTDPEKADDATKEALRYRTALMQGFKDVQERPLSTRTAMLVWRAIKNVDLDVRQVPGTALAHHPSGKIVYTPPEGQALLREKLSNLEQFLHGHDDIDPVIRMAAAHYQFEAIHPFTDGNGRTGRILNTLFLIDKKLLDLPILYLSRYINEHRSEYYDRLLAVTTKGAWEAWLLYKACCWKGGKGGRTSTSTSASWSSLPPTAMTLRSSPEAGCGLDVYPARPRFLSMPAISGARPRNATYASSGSR
jgi:Fic family protein